jgi:nucleoside-diphosphate-sugar epimerase
MKVLVIGGAGYIGSTLTRCLWSRGFEVTVLDLLLFGGESLVTLWGQPRFRLIAGDLRDEQLLAKIVPGHDAVVLLAAIVGEPACNRDPELAIQTNLYGTRKVLAACRAAGTTRLVFASTCSNYGATNSDKFVDETAPLNPISTYAQTKVEAENEILAAANHSFCPTILRFSTAFGVSARMRFDLMVSDFTLAAVRHRKVVVYGEQFWRPFVHIQDICESIWTVLNANPANVSGAVYNVGSNSANVQKLVLAKKVQQQVEGTELEFVQQGKDPRSYRVNFAKIERQLGFSAGWSVDDGIVEVHRALRAGLWANPDDSRFHN